MYRKTLPTPTTIIAGESLEGETIEQMLRRIKNNKEPISDGAQPLLYTEKSEGVIPEYDIRSDKFELLLDEGEKAIAQAEANKKAFQEKLDKENKKNGGAESTQATE